jgi:DNA repair exonuclease SbcCD ATPase subunit
MPSGIVFKSLSIKNGKVFDNVVIPLEDQGLVSIQGDTGVGKSSIWDILETVIYGSSPEGFKKDELTKNEDDCEFKLVMSKNEEPVIATLQRKAKKWSYQILKGNTPCTDHTYYDAIKNISSIVGLTKDEFEGSVHLTQSAQHMLIKGTLSQRKDYISAFFGIDDRYDEVWTAAKGELAAQEENIKRLSGLSHSKQMLETELRNLQIKDVEPLNNKLSTLQKSSDEITPKLLDIDKKIDTWQRYELHVAAATEYENPLQELSVTEKRIVELNTKVLSCQQIKERNEKARSNNNKLSALQFEISGILNQAPSVVTDTVPIATYEAELSDLIAIQKQNIAVAALRSEVVQLPDVKELPISRIEEELVNLQVLYQAHLKNKNAKERGICPECGSIFTGQDIAKEINILKEIKENLDILNQDYQTIKLRNTKAKRRSLLLEQLSKVPEFSEQHESRIKLLQSYIQLKKRYEMFVAQASVLSYMEIDPDEMDTQEVVADLQKLNSLKDRIKLCCRALEMLPSPPQEAINDLKAQKADMHNQLLNLKTFIESTQRAIGESRVTAETHNRLTIQLTDIEKKLSDLDSLKKKEFFWSKLVEAYGPKGLRVQQLEKMMDLILRHLPVYVSILFNEKNMTFTHKVDANNVKIIATREMLNADGKVVHSFQHDIGAFSGGEKDLMSTGFILTLADCIPVHKRANILILDEVDSQLDEGIKFRFTNELLPMLKKKYSSIFVISHDKNVQLANIYDQIWSITKKNHTSEISIQHLN